ncbi:polysaccharide export outer membrane protein [Novosphingobium kunmingense]|uniref:Polysaccharide export outer membrane protein n=1 Tax=Novosphingobium kunmingense TaxID=1211806 RepID=A0A2N0HK21_9SPHN|nr:polysaccharide biosynthesis/export family protein [Novosphingobium kunmingense]PKB19300.1 polysaccharide export outer membrane protein [Novosphingobium kunmingense]
MTSKAALALAALAALVLSGCDRSGPNLLPTGAAAADLFPVRAAAATEDEVLRVGDRLAIRVLGEPELTSDLYRVDGSGNVQVPLAGEIPAAGLRPAELREELTRRLGRRFIRNPQVAVIVTERNKTTFAVEGNVREPGVFEATPTTTLISAIAQAKSPTETASLDEVMVFRIINGQRAGARFNLKDIRRGNAPDPQILAGDTVVVGNSALKGAWREFLQAAPAFNLFYIFR